MSYFCQPFCLTNQLVNIQNMEENRKNTRQMILEAAEAEFLEKGYNGTTTAGIAARANVTHAMLHYYFQTKENLFEMFVKEKIALGKEAIFPIDVLSPELSMEEVVRFIVGHHMDFIMEHPELPKFMLKEMFFDEARRQAFYDIVLNDKKVAELSGIIGNIAARDGYGKDFDMRSMMLDIAHYNIATFISVIVRKDLNLDREESMDVMMERRKEECVELIMRRFRK